ncbi:MAG: hypothetical protein IPJ09_03235 [Saprospiraceae bacterium]|nr:hypothetical protein [Saprospiraceae bacterium]
MFKKMQNFMIEKFNALLRMKFKKSSNPNLFIWLGLSALSIIIYSINPIFYLNENQTLYLFSSASQVIAAIFGLIITGYIFLRNELDRKAERDETLEEIIFLLKTDYFGSIKSISITTLISIALCFLVIVAEKYQYASLLDYLINLSVATILTDLIIIVSFVIKILNPNSIELASNKLRDITTKDKANESGSLEAFLMHYNNIEYILEKYGTIIVYPDVTDYDSAKRKRIAKSKLVNILYKEGKINLQLKNNLIELISFRNSLIHGTDLFVSIRDVELSNQILVDLKTSLGVA